MVMTFIADAFSASWLKTHQFFSPFHLLFLPADMVVSISAMYLRTRLVSTFADTRRARPKARRDSACSHAWRVGVIHAPRPGMTRLGSGIIRVGSSGSTTTRKSFVAGSSWRVAMHVRTGSCFLLIFAYRRPLPQQFCQIEANEPPYATFA